ncbi:glycosyltransferase [uncultured Thiodictyon sp.]|uniref:glycosyltransferase family 2 protein n=1 Tax=uncultured Thiodictyon sp. TaxID=1846217 RepID=UPI0025D2663B|nr:glycosyltransferase [uncultured Thiodictyon sp.]
MIIPTAGARPALLMRAVRSALEGLPAGAVEIVVVPNGPGESTITTSQAVREACGTQAVRIFPLARANVSAARNHGLSVIQGELVRFLDDDDFLIPEVATRQYQELLGSSADLSSYALVIEDEDRRRYETVCQWDDEDFVVAQLSRAGPQLPFPHVFKTGLVRNLRWKESYRVVEDIAWIHTVAGQREVRWIRRDDVVGVWYQHRGPRLSHPLAAHQTFFLTAESIIETVDRLGKSGRLSERRKKAAALGLWTCLHNGFFFHPLYWHGIGRAASALDLSSHPDIALYRGAAATILNPLLWEWLMLPKRTLNHWLRVVRARLFGVDHVRHL